MVQRDQHPGHHEREKDVQRAAPGRRDSPCCGNKKQRCSDAPPNLRAGGGRKLPRAAADELFEIQFHSLLRLTTPEHARVNAASFARHAASPRGNGGPEPF